MNRTNTGDARVLDCGTLSKVNEYTINIRFNDGFNVGLDDAIAVRDAALELFENRKFLAIIDARNIGGAIGKRASNFFARDEKLASYRMAQAIVVNTLALKLVARFYIKISKPRREAKIFNDYEEALEWLETKKHLLE